MWYIQNLNKLLSFAHGTLRICMVVESPFKFQILMPRQPFQYIS
uniref:Uncharacterized protein n=1 Tax=Arundo donax TaxID=35708 RepID=A0A0A9AW53_ARUDO